MIRLLTTVDPAGMQPQINLAIQVAEPIWKKYGADTLWITSLNDGTHKIGSLHYKGLAVDLRVKNLPPTLWSQTVAELQAALGFKYDVLLEMDPPHCHVEYDPKPV